MTWFEEKLLYSATVLISGFLCWIGAILSEGDIRWLYATMASSVMTSGFLGLILRKEGESIQIVIARAALGVFGGVFGTKIGVVSFESLNHLSVKLESDVLFLSGVAGIFAAFFNVVGFAFIKVADASAQSVSKRLLEKLLFILGLKNPPDER